MRARHLCQANARSPLQEMLWAPALGVMVLRSRRKKGTREKGTKKGRRTKTAPHHCWGMAHLLSTDQSSCVDEHDLILIENYCKQVSEV